MHIRNSLIFFLCLDFINKATFVCSIHDLCTILTDNLQNSTACSANYNGVWSINLKKTKNIYLQSMEFVQAGDIIRDRVQKDLGYYRISIKSDDNTVSQCNGSIRRQLVDAENVDTRQDAMANVIKEIVSCR